MVDFDKDRDANLAAFELTGGAAANGLTVRDYFAATAMNLIYGYRAKRPGMIAKQAYEMADAMIAERKNPIVKYDSFLERDISELELTVRAENCCRASEIYTIGHLVKMSERHLTMMPNLGKKTIKEIKDALAAHDLKLACDYSVEEAFGL